MENVLNPRKRKASDSDTSTTQRRVVPRESVHYVATPNGYSSESIHGTVFQGEPPHLDDFLRTSLSCLERQESILVPAGQTLVVEHAIAMALRDDKKVIYTSPLKTFSNHQNFLRFGVSVMTAGQADVSAASSNSTCFVMTTDLLLETILTKPRLLDNVGWVVFDSIHYMEDMERRVVWEECIILLPPAIKMVFLSASMSNASQFAQWICNVRKHPCHVVYTGVRHTPLHHYAYPVGVDEKFLLVDESKEFLESNFLEMKNKFLTEEELLKLKLKDVKKDGLTWDETQVHKVVKMIELGGNLPVIIFSSSSQKCEEYATSVSKYHFNDNKEERREVKEIFKKAMLHLGEEDQHLSIVKDMLAYFKAGIAVHHSGLHPIIKELVEHLFQKGLVKVLFATEMFAGLNISAKTVVLTSAKKEDGDSKRYVEYDEYIQMSDRAGLRSQEQGESVLMIDEQIEMNSLKDMVLGEPAPLVSAFRLTFNLILNLTGGQITAEDVIKKSFNLFQYEQTFLNQDNEIRNLEDTLANLQASGGEDAVGYANLKSESFKLEKKILAEMKEYPTCFTFLKSGRLVKVEEHGTDSGWGIVNSVRRTDTGLIVDIFQPDSIGPCEWMQVVSLRAFPLSSLSALSEQCIDLPETDLSLTGVESITVRRNILLDLQELENKFPQGLPNLNPLNEKYNFTDHPMLANLVGQRVKLEAQLSSHSSVKVQEVCKKIDQLKTQKADSQFEKFRAELHNRLKVLAKLEHIDAEGILTQKGQAACLIRTGDELLAIEAMLNATTFNDLNEQEIAILASCFIPGYKSQKKVQVSTKLTERVKSLQATARRIAQIQQGCKLLVDVEEYVEAAVNSFSMGTVYGWSEGSSFLDMTEKTGICAGDIIRLVITLDEFLNELSHAADTAGEKILKEKFVAAGKRIRRGLPSGMKYGLNLRGPSEQNKQPAIHPLPSAIGYGGDEEHDVERDIY